MATPKGNLLWPGTNSPSPFSEGGKENNRRLFRDFQLCTRSSLQALREKYLKQLFSGELLPEKKKQSHRVRKMRTNTTSVRKIPVAEGEEPYGITATVRRILSGSPLQRHRLTAAKHHQGWLLPGYSGSPMVFNEQRIFRAHTEM